MSDYSPVPISSASVSPDNAILNGLSLEETQNFALTIAEAASDRKGTDIILLNVSDVSYLADFFVLVTGFSNVQVRAIARSIEDKVEQEWQRYPLRTEGKAEGSWILQDYGEVIVHIFMPQERQFYNLEAFWGHAERIEYISQANP